jgi:hypothetical protein
MALKTFWILFFLGTLVSTDVWAQLKEESHSHAKAGNNPSFLPNSSQTEQQITPEQAKILMEALEKYKIQIEKQNKMLEQME